MNPPGCVIRTPDLLDILAQNQISTNSSIIELKNDYKSIDSFRDTNLPGMISCKMEISKGPVTMIENKELDEKCSTNSTLNNGINNTQRAYIEGTDVDPAATVSNSVGNSTRNIAMDSQSLCLLVNEISMGEVDNMKQSGKFLTY